MCKHYSKYVFLFCTLFSSGASYARIVSADEARAEAANFFKGVGCMRLEKSDALQLVHTARDSRGEAAYYVFNAKDNHGFAILAADDAKSRVVGFSLENIFNPGSVPTALTSSLAELPNDESGSKGMSKKAQRLPQGVPAIKQLKTPSWSQESPFNSQIPGGKLTGCVATALATVMKYYSYPAQGKGSAGGADFNVSYDWSNMRMDNYRSGYSAVEGAAVGQLMWHAAASILTDFGQSSSSAFEIRVPSALINHFGYDAGVSYKKRSELDLDAWDSIIVNEIANGRPVIYSGQDVASGHAFICDGYQMALGRSYFHINWGWGGTADGFFLSDALTPQGSKPHNYGDQQTIIYNIKPASNQTVWSAIHITSDNRQPGLTIDHTDLNPGESFTLRAGALKNIENFDFKGKIVPALYDAQGNRKALLATPRSFSLPMLQVQDIIDFTCLVPAGTEIYMGDVVRLATQTEGSDEWLPVASELIVSGQATAMGGVLPTFAVSLPSGDENYSVESASNEVIRGRDFTFKVSSLKAGNVVTVKANGFILSPVAANTYRISNVCANQEIRVIVQNEKDVVSRKAIYVTAGKLSTLLDENETSSIKDLTLFGTINASDFTFMREKMKLTRVDLSGVQIAADGSNPANAIPAYAFNEVGSLQEVILPSSINTIKMSAFRYTGLRRIELPAGVSKYEYNLFVGCGNLHEVVARRSRPEFINWCVFSGCPRTRLIVPVGAKAAYAAKDEWKLFKNIEEQNPVAASSYSVAVQDAKGVNIIPLNDVASVAPGSEYKFRVETDGSEGDATVEVYAGMNRLYPGADGLYTALINSNTLIYSSLRHPVAAATNSVWEYTDALEGAGLVTDIINIPFNKSFTVRANAISIPQNAANLYYAAVLTDGKGGVKEVISPIVYNGIYNNGNKAFDFTCQVRESSIKQGNSVMIATSLDKKMWSLVRSAKSSVSDKVDAVGNKVVYHSVNFADQPNAVVTGKTTEVVHGMPYSFKVIPAVEKDAVSVIVNGKILANSVSIAEVTVPSVNADLNIDIQVGPASSYTYINVNTGAGELASKIPTPTPSYLKINGQMNYGDFAAIRKLGTGVKGLDLTNVKIVGNLNEQNMLPSLAFDGCSDLCEVILPADLTGIAANALKSVGKITELTIPKDVSYIGSAALADCKALTKLTVLNPMPATTPADPFPADKSKINLITPTGARGNYMGASYWKDLKIAGAEYYSVTVDKSRLFQFNSTQMLSRFAGPVTGSLTVSLGMPNCPIPNDRNITMRPGVPFKLYMDGKDVMTLTDWSSIKSDQFKTSYTNAFGSMKGGQYLIKYNKASSSPNNPDYPRNHAMDLVFFYALNFNLPAGVSSQMIADKNDPEKVWNGVKWEYFDAKGNNVMYAEGKDHSFKLEGAPAGMTYKVKCVSRVCTAPGKSLPNKPVVAPVYENREFMVDCNGDGVYTINNLQGDTRISVTLVPEEGVKMTAEQVKNVDPETAREVTNVSMSGEVDAAALQTIRNNFSNVTNLDLTEVTNTSIPDNAFQGMEKLTSVDIPDNVTELGAGAFSGCSNLSSITLNSVNSIGEGAFAGCSNLTSIVINSRGGATRAGSSVSANSFSGTNPNLIIMVADAAMAAQIGEGYNVVLNNNGARKAISNIALNANHPFSSPSSFSLNGNSITCNVDVKNATPESEGNWRGLVLPFTPQGVEVAALATRAGRSANPVLVYGFDAEDAAELSEQNIEALVPNRPYLLQVVGNQGESSTVKFTAAGNANSEVEEVVATPVADEIRAKGESFTLYGRYDSAPASDADYLLDAEGMVFRLRNADDASVNVAPFEVYLRANDSYAPDHFKVSSFIQTGVKDVEGVNVEGLSISREGSLLIVNSASARTLDVFNTAGARVATMVLNEGRNSIQLPGGIYLVAGVKILM